MTERPYVTDGYSRKSVDNRLRLCWSATVWLVVRFDGLVRLPRSLPRTQRANRSSANRSSRIATMRSPVLPSQSGGIWPRFH